MMGSHRPPSEAREPHGEARQEGGRWHAEPAADAGSAQFSRHAWRMWAYCRPQCRLRRGSHSKLASAMAINDNGTTRDWAMCAAPIVGRHAGSQRLLSHRIDYEESVQEVRMSGKNDSVCVPGIRAERYFFSGLSAVVVGGEMWGTEANASKISTKPMIYGVGWWRGRSC